MKAINYIIKIIFSYLLLIMQFFTLYFYILKIVLKISIHKEIIYILITLI